MEYTNPAQIVYEQVSGSMQPFAPFLPEFNESLIPLCPDFSCRFFNKSDQPVGLIKLIKLPGFADVRTGNHTQRKNGQNWQPEQYSPGYHLTECFKNPFHAVRASLKF
jgi:hypothetical protein